MARGPTFDFSSLFQVTPEATTAKIFADVAERFYVLVGKNRGSVQFN